MATQKRSMRTHKGNVTARARTKSGMKGKGKKGKYPVFDQRSALSALKLRHHGKGVSASSVIAKVSRWANAHNNASVKAAVERARKADRKRKSK
jgi:hypothetical protein